jgi:single-strand DNA-binding protein
MGRITKDLELKTTNGGTQVLKFSVAVDRRAKQGEEKKADFLNCVAFSHQATFIEKYFTKGSSIIVIGRIQTGSYEGNNGKVYTTDVVVEEVHFAGGKKQEGQQPKSDADDSGFNVNMNNNDDDLPF